MSQQGSNRTDFFGEFPRINTVDSRDVVVLEPLGQTLVRRPMRVLPRIGTDHQCGNVNLIALKVFGQVELIPDGVVGDAVISNEGEGQHEDLTAVRWVCQGLGVAHHARVEDYLSGDAGGGAEAASFDWWGSIGEDEVGEFALRSTSRQKGRREESRVGWVRGGCLERFSGGKTGQGRTQNIYNNWHRRRIAAPSSTEEQRSDLTLLSSAEKPLSTSMFPFSADIHDYI